MREVSSLVSLLLVLVTDFLLSKVPETAVKNYASAVVFSPLSSNKDDDGVKEDETGGE